MVLGLLWSNVSYSDSIKDMILSCAHKTHVVQLLGGIKKFPKQESYDISIKNNRASFTGPSFYYNYNNFILKRMSNEEYYFINENNNDKLFARIKINRVKATALVAQINDMTSSPIDFELIELKNCKLLDNKPKF